MHQKCVAASCAVFLSGCGGGGFLSTSEIIDGVEVNNDVAVVDRREIGIDPVYEAQETHIPVDPETLKGLSFMVQSGGYCYEIRPSLSVRRGASCGVWTETLGSYTGTEGSLNDFAIIGGKHGMWQLFSGGTLCAGKTSVPKVRFVQDDKSNSMQLVFFDDYVYELDCDFHMTLIAPPGQYKSCSQNGPNCDRSYISPFFSRNAVKLEMGDQCSYGLNGWKLTSHHHYDKDAKIHGGSSKIGGLTRANLHKSSSNCVTWDINPMDDGTYEISIATSPAGSCSHGEVKRAKLALYGTERDSSSSWAYVSDGVSSCTKWNIEATNDLTDGPYLITVAESCGHKDDVGRALAVHKNKRDKNSKWAMVHESSTNCRRWIIR